LGIVPARAPGRTLLRRRRRGEQHSREQCRAVSQSRTDLLRSFDQAAAAGPPVSALAVVAAGASRPASRGGQLTLAGLLAGWRVTGAALRCLARALTGVIQRRTIRALVVVSRSWASMQIDPVYVVAPRESRPSMSSRRAFMGMGLCFVAGGAVGVACGYSIGVANAGPSVDPAAPTEDDLKSTGDADLDELRRLAVKAPIEELVEKNLMFFMNLDRTYRTDPVLWKGVDRLAAQVLSNEGTKNRAIIVKQLLAVIEKDKPPPALHLDRYVPDLRRAGK